MASLPEGYAERLSEIYPGRYRRARRGQEAWGALALAAAMLRVVVYAIVTVAALFLGSGFALGNDEPIAARLLGLPSLSFVGLLAPLFAGVV